MLSNGQLDPKHKLTNYHPNGTYHQEIQGPVQPGPRPRPGMVWAGFGPWVLERGLGLDPKFGYD